MKKTILFLVFAGFFLASSSFAQSNDVQAVLKIGMTSVQARQVLSRFRARQTNLQILSEQNTKSYEIPGIDSYITFSYDMDDVIISLSLYTINGFKSDPGNEWRDVTQVDLNSLREGTDGDQRITCEELEGKIDLLIAERQTCERDEDCYLDETSLGCPFGCDWIRSHFYDDGELIALIEDKVQSYVQQGCFVCGFPCPTPPGFDDIQCLQGRCVDARVD